MKNPETLLLNYAHILSCCTLGRYLSLSDFVSCIGSELFCAGNFNIVYKSAPTYTVYTVTTFKKDIHIYSDPNVLSVRIRRGILTPKDVFMYLGYNSIRYDYYWFDLALKYKKPLYDLLTGIVNGSEAIIPIPMPIFNSQVWPEQGAKVIVLGQIV